MTSVESFCYAPDKKADNYCDLDLYSSPNTNNGTPLIALVHGGAWRSEDKSDYKDLAMGLVDLGFTVASINYRLSKKEGQEVPDIQHPSHILDVGQALEYLYNNSSGKFDKENMVVVGHSAGAHIAIMLLLNPGYERFINGVIGVSGIYDIPLLVKTYPSYLDFIAQAFGESDYFKASPVSQMELANKQKLIVIAQSSEDTLINNEQSDVMAAYLKDKLGAERVILDMSLKGDHYEIMKWEKLQHLVLLFKK